MSAYSSPPAVTCAENVALLHLLHSVPVPPSRNEISNHPFRTGSYLLPFHRERDLASTLAFLSNTKDDSNHVPALCIEENPDSESLNVMLAVNRAKWEDGNEVLHNLKQSLEEIFTVLSEISEERGRNRSIEHRVFTAIVSMCSLRILRRLRFVPKNRGTPKQPLKAVLSETINSLKQVDQHMLNKTTFQLFTNRSKEVMKLADLWAKHQKPAELEDLIEGIYQLKQIGDLRVLMDLIPNRAMCPSSRQNLVNIVSKVSRYREAARFLCRTARDVPALRRAKVVLVSLPRKAFERVSSEYVSPQLVSTIARISRNHEAPDVGYLGRLLKTSAQKLKKEFAVQTGKTLREAKIHAEVQLIFHYELNASSPPPRVVCSSKDACFLCNAFIVMHGKMYMPGHHGRLYPGWRLPSISSLIDVEQRLNMALEDHVRESLKVLLSRKKKTIYPDPNESTLLTLKFSTSTLQTSALAEATEREASSVDNTLGDDTVRPRESLACAKKRASLTLPKNKEDASSLPSLRSATTAEKDEFSDTRLSKRYAIQESSQCNVETMRHKDSSTCGTTKLVQGVPQTSSVGIACETQFHTARGLELYVEYTAGLMSGANTDNWKVPYSIEWVSVEKARALIDHRAAVVLDVEALQGETSHELDCHDGILIMARGLFVRIMSRRYDGGIGRKVK